MNERRNNLHVKTTLSIILLEPLRKIVQDGREILIIDFSNLKEEEMMKLLSASRKLLLEEKRMQKLLAIFHKNYVTSKVMRHFEADQVEAIKFSEKLACTGLSVTQKMILKGYNVIFNRDVKAFDNQEEAIRYLLDDSVK